MGKKLLSIIAAICFLGVAFAAGILVEQTAAEETKSHVNGNPVQDPPEINTEHLAFYGLDIFETTLPVVYIDTNNHLITKENKVWAALQVSEAPEGTSQSILEVPDYEAAITIKYRGASSFHSFDKKQYRIKFYKEMGSGNAENVTFLGMGSNSEWVLNGPFLDKTLMRNRLTYGLAGEIFEWAPDSRYVEVFLNGEYQGVYLALEPITNGESRLRLGEFGLLYGATAYVVKRDRVGTEEGALESYGKLSGRTSNDLYIEYPSKTDLTEAQRTWIVNDISEFERVLYGEDFANPQKGYMSYIDVDNFVDYVIFNEVFMNNDAGNLSTYVYKELNGKMKMAVWDYNNCLDNYQGAAQDFTHYITPQAAWFSRMLEDRNFVKRLVSRYEELRRGVLSTAYVNGKIEEYQKELGEARERNFAVWGYSFNSNLLVGSGRELQSYEEAIAQLKAAYERRTEYMDAHISDFYDGCVN